MARLLTLPQVMRVTVQTNLSFDLEAWLDEIDTRKLALWTTYHPTETALEPLLDKWDLLRQRGVPFSVGIVGMRENIPRAETLRRILPIDVYLWVNSYKREAGYYGPEELARIVAVDPLFHLNDQRYPSLGKPCTAGHEAIYLDDQGDLRRCFFVGDVLGNLFRDGWVTHDQPTPCPALTCDCYVGQMHAVELGYRAVYGDYLAARIPRAANPARQSLSSHSS